MQRASHWRLLPMYDLCTLLALAAARASMRDVAKLHPAQVRKQLALLVQCIGVNKFIQPLAGQNRLYIILRHANAVICNAALREVIGPYLLGPVAAAGLCHPIRTCR